ncbi:MAG TPA: Dyp-type peroxidase [Conexibacter sp.]|jgi:deferrochelatase/peroxidase EfeB
MRLPPSRARPVNRRSFLKRSAVTLGATGLASATAVELTGGNALGADSASLETLERDSLLNRVAYDGPHQPGILQPAAAFATVAALDCVAADASQLVLGLQALTVRARQLTQGTTMPDQEVDEPPADSGTLGPVILPDATTVTVAFGATLFDDRYGLKGKKPVHLAPMEPFANDDLDPAQTGGDLLIQITAQHRDTVVHTLRELVRVARAQFVLRWTVDAFQSADRGPTSRSSRRNLFGFRDGTSNPDTTSADDMNRLIWAGSEEPSWAGGGTYQVVRTIRMHVEFWDRVGLREQEDMIGRTRDTGAPQGGTGEFDDPRFDVDPRGERIQLDAHIRLANPRTPKTDDERILRRGYNYHRGIDAAGQLDQGLLFVAFNQNPERQFKAIQRRLDGEPMVDYITPVGGGYFFAPPGTRDGADWIGSGLFG